jgi:hypothetical protein
MPAKMSEIVSDPARRSARPATPKTVPVVRVRTVRSWKPIPGLGTTSPARALEGWRRDRDAPGLDDADEEVRSGVLVIFFRPSSPSLDSHSR